MSRSCAERRVAPAQPSAEPKVIRQPRRKTRRRAWLPVSLAAAGICLLGAVLFTLTRVTAPSAKGESKGGQDATGRPEPIKASAPAIADRKVDGPAPMPVPTVIVPEASLAPPPLAKPSPTVDCAQLGTRIVFYKDPPRAFGAARLEDKLVFFVHLSGNFEDDAFT